MPRIESHADVEQPIELVFALSQTYGELRYRWDPFVKEQHLLDGATQAAKGVRTSTTSHHGLHMVSEYLSFRPPTQVGMRMVEGPWFFETFSGGWSFAQLDDGRVRATWRYTFSVKPKALAPIADRIGKVVLQRDIDRRLAAFAEACADPSIMEAVRAAMPEPPEA